MDTITLFLLASLVNLIIVPLQPNIIIPHQLGVTLTIQSLLRQNIILHLKLHQAMYLIDIQHQLHQHIITPLKIHQAMNLFCITPELLQYTTLPLKLYVPIILVISERKMCLKAIILHLVAIMLRSQPHAIIQVYIACILLVDLRHLYILPLKATIRHLVEAMLMPHLPPATILLPNQVTDHRRLILPGGAMVENQHHHHTVMKTMHRLHRMVLYMNLPNRS